jgi:hypothetical protein
MGSYKGFTSEKINKKNFDLAQKFFSFFVVLGLSGKIVPHLIMAQSKNVLVTS